MQEKWMYEQAFTMTMPFYDSCGCCQFGNRVVRGKVILMPNFKRTISHL